jgi:DNA invertase Pin-like site-specific DNA recombinase
MALAYSYIRFSSEKQSQGDSVRRQSKLAADYAVLHNLSLDNSTYRDLGVSALYGKNFEEGMLGAFVEAVKLGKIPKGSYLLVEALDRITRADINTALALFLKIIGTGIILVTLQDGQVYSAEKNTHDQGIGLIISIIKMIQGHEESIKKQFRVRESWKTKRAEAVDGKKMTAVCPSWLSLSENRKDWIIDTAKAAVVKRIFDLSLSGVGTPTIARTFNAEGVPSMKRSSTWTYGVINAILKNESVIGTFTPKKVNAESIKSYYPQIISDTQFYMIREHLLKRRWVSGHNGVRVINLFSGISFCASCNNVMRITSALTGGKAYIKCKISHAGGDCDEKVFPLYAAERAILDHLAKWVSIHSTAQTSEVIDPRFELECKKADIDLKIENLIDALMTVKSEQIRNRINKLRDEKHQIESQLLKVVNPKAQIAATVEAMELFAKLKTPEFLTVSERLNVQTKLKRLIESIHFSTDGIPTVAIKYNQFFKHTDYIDVTPFLDKVGGDRRKFSSKE